jgi:hypothetical protein
MVLSLGVFFSFGVCQFCVALLFSESDLKNILLVPRIFFHIHLGCCICNFFYSCISFFCLVFVSVPCTIVCDLSALCVLNYFPFLQIFCDISQKCDMAVEITISRQI